MKPVLGQLDCPKRSQFEENHPKYFIKSDLTSFKTKDVEIILKLYISTFKMQIGRNIVRFLVAVFTG